MPVGVCEFDSHLPHRNRLQRFSEADFSVDKLVIVFPTQDSGIAAVIISEFFI